MSAAPDRARSKRASPKPSRVSDWSTFERGLRPRNPAVGRGSRGRQGGARRRRATTAGRGTKSPFGSKVPLVEQLLLEQRELLDRLRILPAARELDEFLVHPIQAPRDHVGQRGDDL